jgi:acetyl esterase/lipase
MTRVLAIMGIILLPALASAEEKKSPATDNTRGPAAVTYSIKESLDLAYADGGKRNRLDVFAPKVEGKERFPVVLFAHGGTWMFGDKNFFGIYRKAGKNLAKNGVVAVMTNYRLSPLVRHPEHVKDVARAYAWVVKNIDRYGGDPDRVILAGHSAGGHIASLLAADERYLKDPKLKLTDAQRKGVRGVVSLSGVYRVPSEDEFRDMMAPILRFLVGDPGKSGFAWAITPMLRKVGHGFNPFPWIFGGDRRMCDDASPLCHVRKGLPPFLLLTAEYEVPRLRGMAEEFESALKKVGADVTYKDLDGCTHQTIINCLHSDDNDISREVLAFIQKHGGKAEKKS